MSTSLELRTLLKSSGELELSVVSVPVADPGPDEVQVEVRAAPINPSDLGLLLGPADPSSARRSGEGASATLTLSVHESFLRALALRLDQSMPVGNEGAGVVVKAGSSADAQALLGKTVTMVGGGMFAQLRTARARDVLPLPAHISASEGASAFVNPMTALAMVETMRREGHSALVHTAAASNLGQMLVKLCQAEGVALVNIVRKPEQAQLLRELGAVHVVDSSAPSFKGDLVAALTETGATLAFDAVGGGKLAAQILSGMEAAALAKMSAYSRYGSSVHKQVYIYGLLDTGPTELPRGVGFAWSVSGFLLTHFLQKLPPADFARLRRTVVEGLQSTFASQYTAVIPLEDVLDPEVLSRIARRATGEKFLIDPSLRS